MSNNRADAGSHGYFGDLSPNQKPVGNWTVPTGIAIILSANLSVSATQLKWSDTQLFTFKDKICKSRNKSFEIEPNLESYLALSVMMLHDGVVVRLVARSAPIGFQIAAPKLGAHWLHGAGHFLHAPLRSLQSESIQNHTTS